MHHQRERFSERTLRRIRSVLQFALQELDALQRLECHSLQQCDHVCISSAHHILVKRKRRKLLWRKPNRAAFRLAKLFPIRLGKERKREPKQSAALFAVCATFGSGRVFARHAKLPREFDSGRNVAPLVRPSKLNTNAFTATQMHKVVRLQKLIREFCERHSFAICAQSILHRLLVEHSVYTRVLAYVPQKFQKAHRTHPGAVVHKLGLGKLTACKLWRRFARQHSSDVARYSGHVDLDCVVIELRAFCRLARRIAYLTGGAADESYGFMTVQLKPPQNDNGEQVSQMQRIRCGIKPDIHRCRLLQ
mmetsp:Transcript_9007/g.23606  ORF Transcript_9007/g.23606 Transcript_9007/m.23606 type:complete len:306 (-) Transcript_9007:328-1245(-)